MNAAVSRRSSVDLILRDLTVTVLLFSMFLSLSTQLLSPASESSDIFGYRKVTWIEFEQTDPYVLLLYDARLSVGGSETSTDSPFSANYESLLAGTNGWGAFEELSELLYPEDSYVIPGISNTNLAQTGTSHMVPQGLCIAGDYVLISAYSSTKKKTNSVIYVMDRTSHDYITTIELNLKSHVGALAFSEDADGYVYIADSNAYDTRIPNVTSAGNAWSSDNSGSADHADSAAAVSSVSSTRYKIWKLPLSEIILAAENGQDSQQVNLTSFLTTTVCPAFLCTYENYLFVGDFNYNAEDNYTSYMRGYDLTTGEAVIDRMELDRTTQGVSIADYNGTTYLITSHSYGRNNVSELKVRRLIKSETFDWYPSRFITRRILIPNMSEDIDVVDGHVLINFESASSKYQKNNHTRVQLDRVLNLSLKGLIDKTIVVTPLVRRSTAATAQEDESGQFPSDMQISGSADSDFVFDRLCDALPTDPFDFDEKHHYGRLRKVLS